MMDADKQQRLQTLSSRIAEMRAELRGLLAESAAADVADYEFATLAGPRRLSALFGDKRDLFVVHNMGGGCAYCTMWADGFSGLYPHLAARAAFVVSSPDAPAAQAAIREKRGWQFPMVSHAGSSFARDMGFVGEAGGFRPGVSAFQLRDGKPVRVSATPFGPYDDYCAAWHLFDLLPERAAAWQPKLHYA